MSKRIIGNRSAVIVAALLFAIGAGGIWWRTVSPAARVAGVVASVDGAVPRESTPDDGSRAGAGGHTVAASPSAPGEGGAVPARSPESKTEQAAELATRDRSAKSLFDEGHDLILWNARDSVSVDYAQLEMGVARVEEALRRGYPSRLEPLQSLKDGYFSLLSLDGLSDERRRVLVRRLSEVLQEAAQLEPDNEDAALASIEMVTDPSERLAALRQAARRFPARVRPQLMMGTLLCELKRPEEANTFFVRAAEVLPVGDPDSLGPQITNDSYRCLGPALGKRISEIVGSKEAKR